MAKANPFQHLYGQLKSTDPNLYEALNRLFDGFSDVVDRLGALESSIAHKAVVSDSGLDWLSNSLYDQYTLVRYAGHLYIRLFSGRSSITPNVDTRNWFFLT